MLVVHGALHPVVFVDVQVRMVVPPLATVWGLAVSVTLGAGALTLTWVC
jgi:hypothetical protein